MRSGLAISIVVSLVLIAGAFWYRFSAGHKTADFTLTDNPSAQGDYESTSTLAIGSDDTVNKTDNLGKQLLSDLITLNASGQATDDNIQELSSTYISNLPQLINTKTADKSQLNIVGNSKAEIDNYAKNIDAILTTYSTSIKALSPESKTLNSAFYDAAGQMGSVYKSTADKLLALQTPDSLVDLHLKLVNIYLSDSTAMYAVAGGDADPAKAFAGLIKLQSNLEEENSTITAIDMVLSKK